MQSTKHRILRLCSHSRVKVQRYVLIFVLNIFMESASLLSTASVFGAELTKAASPVFFLLLLVTSSKPAVFLN